MNAQKLEKDYPEEILEYNYKKAYCKIPNGDRKPYQEAVKYLVKVKAIYERTAESWHSSVESSSCP